MRSLITTVKEMSLRSKQAGNSINFLDKAYHDPGCQKLIEQMNNIDLK